MKQPTIGELLLENGVSRRTFLKYCTAMASLLALPPGSGRALAADLAAARRLPVVYLSFQECTGCAESLTRAFSPAVENLLFNVISLDYQHTLMAAAGHQAEAALAQTIKENAGNYIVIVDGAIPTADGGIYGTSAGRTYVETMREVGKDAAAIISLGTCAAFGGIPMAQPNPTGAVPVSDVISGKPIVNVSGCPPVPEVITGTLFQFVAMGKLPELDAQGRPKVFFGNSIHDRCYRRPFYDEGKFAKTFDDEGARNGWCLYELGCKGPTTYNACATVKWNGQTSWPVESGHGCIGCSEPNFWDKGSFYAPLSQAAFGKAGNVTPRDAVKLVGAAAVVGGAIGLGAAAVSRKRQERLAAETPPAKKEG
jgi:hydrogenase small subunit